MNLFQRAAQNLPLDPVERALRQLVLTFVTVTGPLSGVPLYTDFITSFSQWQATGHWGAVNWDADLHWLVVALIMSVGLALRKYATAQGDPPPVTPPAAAPASPSVPAV